MPARTFPVSVLQNSVKVSFRSHEKLFRHENSVLFRNHKIILKCALQVTNEPPKGLRANTRRAFTEITQSFFEEHSKLSLAIDHYLPFI